MKRAVLILGATLLIYGLMSRCVFQRQLNTAAAELEKPAPFLPGFGPKSSAEDPFPRAGTPRRSFTPKVQAATSAPLTVKDDEELQLVLKEARRAFGYSRLAQLKTGVEAIGRAQSAVAPSPDPIRYSFLFASGGRYVERLEGRVNALFGYDGATSWTLAWTKSKEFQSFDASTSGRLSAWIRSGHWLASRPQFQLSLVRTLSNPGQVAIRIHGPGLIEALLYVDRSTWLPKQLMTTTSAAIERWTFEDYTTVEGVRIARSIGIEGGASFSQLELTEVDVASRSAAELFEPLRFQAGRLKSGRSDAANAPS